MSKIAGNGNEFGKSDLYVNLFELKFEVFALDSLNAFMLTFYA